MRKRNVQNEFAYRNYFSVQKVIVLLVLPLSLAAATQAEVYDLPPAGNDVIGSVTVVPARAEDTLLDIARRHGLGYEDIVRANPDVDTWIPGEGTDVVLPTRFVLPPGPRHGVILNLAEYRMYYFPDANKGERPVVMTYPMSIGRMDWETPLGRTSIISKVTDPAWYPPESIRAEHAADGDPLPRIVPAGPKNPLGRYAMRLGLPGYLIHGTNRPAGVGMRVTHGCVRMFPEDIRFLFRQLAVNTPVTIINEPVKLGWDGDLLVMEVHRTLDVASPVPNPAPESELLVAENSSAGSDTNSESDLPFPDQVTPPVSNNEPDLPQPDRAAPSIQNGEFDLVPRDQMTKLTELFVTVTATRTAELDWVIAEKLLDAAEGIPGPVGRAIKNAATSAASE